MRTEVYNKILGKRIIEYHSFLLAAMSIVDLGKKSEADAIIAKSWEILKQMKKVHPILADENDFSFTVLLAMTDMDVDTIIDRMEQCYTYLRKTIKVRASADSIQSLCEIIILSDGDLTAKCDKAAELFSAFAGRKMHYGSYYEFASLGALIGLDIGTEELVDTIIEAASEMKKNKGFGMFNMDTQTRLMFSALLVAQQISNEKDPLYNYAVNSTMVGNMVASIIADDVAALICTMIIANQTASSYTPAD